MSDSLRDFISLLSDLLTCQDRHDLVPSSSFSLDWLDQLVFTHVMVHVASDARLICDCFVSRDVMAILHAIIDSFSNFQWTGKLSKEDR